MGDQLRSDRGGVALICRIDRIDTDHRDTPWVSCRLIYADVPSPHWVVCWRVRCSVLPHSGWCVVPPSQRAPDEGTEDEPAVLCARLLLRRVPDSAMVRGLSDKLRCGRSLEDHERDWLFQAAGAAARRQRAIG